MTQGLRLRLWRSGVWKGVEDPRAYGALAGHRGAMDRKRRKAADATLVPMTAKVAAHLSDPANPADVELIRVESVDVIEPLLEWPSPRCQLVVRLKILEGLSNAEIADVLHMTPEAVGKQVTNGWAQLRQLLEARGVTSFAEWVWKRPWSRTVVGRAVVVASGSRTGTATGTQ